MPFVQISLRKGRTSTELRAIADGVHEALVETYKVPVDDRFQVINQYDEDTLIFDSGYLGIQRSDNVVIIHILASNWRDTAAKQALYSAVADKLSATAGVRPEDVQVFISNNSKEDWSFGKGIASYVPAA
ncbi:tautomerase family protein [Pseudomonas sp. UBA4194]|uniref:tautomerase family protein n=1 Tax=Pseudomonas sp. UBA4194 TaxID=1947317 RepID=UPI0025D1C253|nr:tautomerase family protein [Pseudomonas sp. UBA4194]